MTSIHDLERTLAEHAATAPDGDGLVAAAYAGAGRFRRRRRIGLAVGGTVLALVAAAAPVAVARLGHAGPTHMASGGRPHRGPLQMTVDLAPDRRYFTLVSGVVGSGIQHLSVRRTDPAPVTANAEVFVYDPGTFDPAPFRRGTPVTVAGHPAFAVDDRAVVKVPRVGTPPEGSLVVHAPAVGWQDPSGAWVVVFGGFDGDRTPALTVAALVRLGPPRDVHVPYRLGYVPAGLPVNAAMTAMGARDAVVGFGAPTPGLPSAHSFMYGLALPAFLVVQADPHTPDLDRSFGGLGAPTPIAGLDTWYLTRSEPGLTVLDGAGLLAVRTPHCLVQISVQDRRRVPYDALKRMVEGARFADCGNPATWTSPLP
jgi:hypothetical protein